MLIDTHCHINMMVKNTFDTPLQQSDVSKAEAIIEQAHDATVSLIINVGTRKIEKSKTFSHTSKFL